MILRLRDKYGRFLLLLVVLVAYLILFPLLEGSQNPVVLLLLTFAIPIAGVYAVSSDRRDLLIALVLTVPVLVVHFTPAVGWPLFVSLGLPLLLYVFVLMTVVREVLGSERVTLDTVFGAAAAYLLLGFVWAVLFSWIETASPGSFVINPANDVGAPGFQWFDAIHFSYVTLTTLGYGEITPVGSLARSFSFLEAATGVLYTAVFVARIVSAYAGRGTEAEAS